MNSELSQCPVYIFFWLFSSKQLDRPTYNVNKSHNPLYRCFLFQWKPKDLTRIAKPLFHVVCLLITPYQSSSVSGAPAFLIFLTFSCFRTFSRMFLHQEYCPWMSWCLLLLCLPCIFLWLVSETFCRLPTQNKAKHLKVSNACSFCLFSASLTEMSAPASLSNIIATSPLPSDSSHHPGTFSNINLYNTIFPPH